MAQSNLGNYNVAAAVSLSDTVNLPKAPCDALYIGVKGATGTAVVVLEDGAAVTFKGLSAGQVLPVKAIRVNNTTTDVTDVVALYQV